MLALLFVGACGEQSSVTGPRPAASPRFLLSQGTPQTFCSATGTTSNVTVTGGAGTGGPALPNGVVPGQASVPWTGNGSNVGDASANWVVPFTGANIDAPDNTTYTYSIGFTVPTGYTASLSGLVLRDNSVATTLDGANIGSEAHNNSKSNFGAAGFTPTPLAISATNIAAGAHTVSFAVWNEDLLALNGNHAYPSALRTAPNPTGILFCFTVTPTPINPPPVALFVIGDKELHRIGDNVNFWGAQWWKNNFMTGQVDNGVAALKGYLTSADQVCGGHWATLPGNSSNPPDVLPSKIVIIVTSTVLKNGPDISGNIVQFLEVNVDPGYAGNPGHEGTGTVTRAFCP